MTKKREARESMDDRCNTEISWIQLRDGRVVPFESTKIRNAILKAGYATGQFGCLMADTLTGRVLEQIVVKFRGNMPTVEQVQDIVEDALIRSPFARTAKAYIVYGNVSCAVWLNGSPAGYFYNTTFSRVYRDGDQWGESASFEDRDLPNLMKASADAHSWIYQQKANAVTTEATDDS